MLQRARANYFLPPRSHTDSFTFPAYSGTAFIETKRALLHNKEIFRYNVHLLCPLSLRDHRDEFTIDRRYKKIITPSLFINHYAHAHVVKCYGENRYGLTYLMKRNIP